MTTTYYMVFRNAPCANCGEEGGTSVEAIRLEASSLESAKREALHVASGECADDDEHKLRKDALSNMGPVRILTVTDEHDLSGEIMNELRRLKSVAAADAKKRNLVKLERLKRKLGAAS